MIFQAWYATPVALVFYSEEKTHKKTELSGLSPSLRISKISTSKNKLMTICTLFLFTKRPTSNFKQ